MGELHLGAPVAGLASRNRITPEDVLMLRREVFQDGVVTRGEAESLFALDAACEHRCPEWHEFFIEAVCDFIVHQEQPRGYVSVDNADWLVRAISRDGTVDSASELEMLVKVIETATSVPDQLSAFALKQVAKAAIEGEGPLACGRKNLQKGVILEAEVGLIRRILYGYGSGGNSGITRAEAEVLFDLNDRTVAARNHPSWDDLFVKALANHLMCASGYTAPSREEALARETFFEEQDVQVGRFFSRMVSGGMSAILSAYRRDDSIETYYAEKNARMDIEGRVAERVDQGEAEWLAARIGRDGRLHDNEKALLSFLRTQSPEIHPALKDLIDQVA
ncbi:MAG: hypothetical protein KDJ73_02530 [Notoacmeibacter sp.]|nr:hypothetical protein [Notoacmeibacter sp.]MCC0031875.1 hypothetical protein [Brucellaceae bacterium]